MLRVVIEHDGHVLTRDRRIRIKRRGARAVDDAVRGRPVDVGRVPAACRHIGKRAGRIAGHVRVGEPGDHGHELRARDVRGRGKGRGGHAVDDAGIIHFLDVRIAPAALGHVRERQAGGLIRRGRRRGHVGEIAHQAQVELAQGRCALRGQVGHRHTGNEVAVVIVAHGHHVPHAGLIADVGVAVALDIAGLAALGQALSGAVGRVQGRDGVHKAVVRRPALVDLETAGSRLVIIAAHLVCKRHEQRRHIGGRRALAGEGALARLVAGVGEVVHIRLDLNVVVELQRAVDRQVTEHVVVVRQKVRVQHAVERLEHGLAVLAVEAELLELEVVHALEVRDAEQLCHGGRDLGGELRHVAAAFEEGRAVVRGCQRRQRIDPVGLAALEKRGDLRAVGLGRSLLLRRAVGQNVQKQADRRAAEAVADEVDLLVRAPAFKQRLVIRHAVARVAVFGRVGRAVVNGRAGELGIELARAIPRARQRANGGGIALIALARQVRHQVARQAPVRSHGVDLVACAPTHQAVDVNGRVAFGTGLLRVCGGGRQKQQASGHHQREQQTQKLLALFHGIAYIPFRRAGARIYFLSIIIPTAPVCNPGNAEDFVSDSDGCEVSGHTAASVAQPRGQLCTNAKNVPRPKPGDVCVLVLRARTARRRPARGSRCRRGGSCRPACR